MALQDGMETTFNSNYTFDGADYYFGLMNTYLNITAYNVNGLGKNCDKLQELCSIIKNFEICCLIETWHKLTDIQKLHVDGYFFYHSERATTKPGRNSGGLVVYMRNFLKPGICIQQSSSDDSVWLKLDKHFFNLQKDCYVGFIYIPPENSRRKTIPDPLSIFETDLISFSSIGDIMLFGDFNARVGLNEEIPDLSVEKSHATKQSGCFSSTVNFTRTSKDEIEKSRGSDLLNLCCALDLILLNGRCIDDLTGKYTSYHWVVVS